MKLKLLPFLLLPFAAAAQQPGELIDKIIAVVGDEIMLYSELEATALQASEGKGLSNDDKCGLMENLLLRKLIVHQAELDSVVVTPSEIEGEIEARLVQFTGMFGSVEEFETYYGKSIAEWKDEFRDDIRDELLYEKERQQLFSKEKVTPADVVSFFEEIPADSLPLIPQKIEYSQIMLKPQVRESEKERTRKFLDSLRTDLINGKTLLTLQARKWSEDPGSNSKGGCYPLQRRGAFVPEYEAQVYNTQEGQYSPVFETSFGYHFVKVVEKRGDYYESCHILMSPKISSQDLTDSKTKLDSLVARLNAGTMTFEAAALKNSTDEDSKNQEGRVINPTTGGTEFEAADLDVNTFFLLDKLESGEISEPILVDNADGTQSYTVFRLNARKPAHIANMKDDYLMFQTFATNEASAAAMEKWVQKALRDTYIRIDPDYATCNYQYPWPVNQP
ncbi:MAG: peptidylprolyl isomerase [Flavobacteriales bacterium]|nr:peptidylprolyl isomerase [Flavobacteriales bacterium]